MAVAKKTQKKKKMSIIIWALLVLVVLVVSYRLVDLEEQQAQRRHEVEVLTAHYQALSTHNAELQRQVARDMSLEEIERIAREQLDMVSPEQRVFLDISGR